MQLAINGVFELTILAIEVDEVMDKCKKLAKFVRRSETRKNELKDACKETETNFILPQLPNTTRQNSKEANVSSTIKLKHPLQHITQADTSLRWSEVVLNAAEFKLLENLVEILERIKVASKVWEADKKPTIQTVIPELFNIQDTLKRKAGSGNRERYVSVFARELLKLIEKRFPECGTRNNLNSVAHLLDPEYRGVILRQFGAYDRACEEVKKIGAKYEAVQDIPLPVQERRDNADQYENLSAAPKLKLLEEAAAGEDRANISASNMTTTTEIELDKFLKMKIPHCSDLLLFYKDHMTVFPILSQIAREIFSIPASSATSERVFSVGSLVSYHKESRPKKKPAKFWTFGILGLTYPYSLIWTKISLDNTFSSYPTYLFIKFGHLLPKSWSKNTNNLD